MPHARFSATSSPLVSRLPRFSRRVTASPFHGPAIARAGASRRTTGFTLLELILVLGVGSMIALLSLQGMKRTAEQQQATIAGQQLRTVGTAVNTYITNRYGQISQLATVPDNVGNTADPGPRTCNAGTGVCTITVKTLLNEGLLPGNYTNNNSFSSTGGTAYTIALKVGGASPNWQVNGLVTTVPWTVGGVVRYDLLGQAMAAAGADSGMVRTNAAEVDGYNGVWSETTASFPNVTQLGQLGFRAGYGSSLYSVYLRRDGTLPMTGDLNMSDGTAHSISNVANVTGNGRYTSAQTYTNYVNLAGNLDMAGTLTVQGSAAITGNATVSGSVITNGITDYGNASVNGTVFTNGLTDYGSASVGGNATVGGTVSATRGVFSAGDGVQVGSSYYYGDTVNSAIRQNGSLFVQNAAGTAAANLYAGYLVPQTYAGVGGACSPNGAIGTDGTQTVFCKLGIWKAAGSVTTVAVSSGGWLASGYAACPAGYNLTGGSCDMNRGGDGREISPRSCEPSGNGYYCNEGNGGTCIAYALCAP